MNKKKIMWFLLLIIFIIIAVVIAVSAKPRDTSNDNSLAIKRINNSQNKNTIANNIDANNDSKNEIATVNTESKYKRKVLSDGILYSQTDELIKADKIIGTNYFDTTINDMYLNPDNYIGKKIEIEGLYLVSEPYTFVGRFSTANVCAYCVGGFSYIQYEFDGMVLEQLKDQETWIKLIGTWEKGKMNYGTEENPYYDDYYYLKVLNFEIMNEKGEDTVKN